MPFNRFSTFSAWQVHCYEVAKSKGWFRSKVPRLAKQLINIHAEVSEAWEEYRKPDFDPKRIYFVNGKPEGLPIELADIVMRTMNTAESHGIDLVAAMQIKDEYNETRPYRHGNKRA